MDRAESYEVPVPFVEDFKQTGDIATYASAYVQFLRAFTEPVLRLALDENPKAQKIVDGIYVRIEQLLMEHPERYPFNYVSAAAMLSRLS